MSEGRDSPDNDGPPGSAMPSTIDVDTSKKASAIPKIAFDDGALKVMEDEFQVKDLVFFSPDISFLSLCSTGSFERIGGR